jgi:hypothetical protein
MKNSYIISAKKKFQGLLILLLLFTVVVYYYGMRPTLEMKASRDRAIYNIALSTRAPEKIQKLKAQLTSYDQKMNQYMEDTLSGGEPLLHLLSDYCNANRIELYKVEPVQNYTKSNYGIETIPVITRGGFKSMLGLAYHLEQVERKGRLVSVSFVKVNDHKIKKEVLELKLFLQTIYAN